MFTYPLKVLLKLFSCILVFLVNWRVYSVDYTQVKHLQQEQHVGGGIYLLFCHLKKPIVSGWPILDEVKFDHLVEVMTPDFSNVKLGILLCR